MTNAQLIEQLNRILPGLENSSSAAEDAMIKALPSVIAALKRDADFEWRPVASISADIPSTEVIEVYTCAPSPPGHVVTMRRGMLADCSGPAHLRTHASHWRPHVPPTPTNGAHND